jgi:hypothetical protein
MRNLVQRAAVADHMTAEQAEASLLDCFRRADRQELELLELRSIEVEAHSKQ